MATNTMDFGKAVASSEYNDGLYSAYKAFNDDEHGWFPDNTTSEQYIEFQSKGKISFRYILAELLVYDGNPYSFEYTASISNDGSTYTNLGTYTIGTNKFITADLGKKYTAKCIRLTVPGTDWHGPGVKIKLISSSGIKQITINNATASFYEEDN